MKTKLLFYSLLLLTFSTFAQYTAIPDSNFEDVLQTLGYDSGANDGQVLTANITSVKKLDIWDYDIADLTGIEDFTDLEELICYGNDLTSLDVSNNLKLENLRCSGSLTGYKLTSLILPNSNTLKELSCSTNALTTIDVSMYTNLENFWCYSNNLTSLDISNNVNLVEFDAESNPNLTCIQVDDVNAIGANWKKDDAASYSESCDAPKTYVPDDNFEQALIDLGLDDTLDDYVVTSNITSIEELVIGYNDIGDLTGIEDFESVTYIDVTSNNLTTLDVSKNLALERLYCLGNALNTLDVSKNINLTELTCAVNNIQTLDVTSNLALNNLQCYNNKISTLDLSKNAALTTLFCDANELTVLNIKNGNNNNLIGLNAKLNPNLVCIEVDDVNAIGGNWEKDSTASYSESCDAPKTYVPDDNFEQALIDLGLDDTLDDYVTTGNISGVTSLNISSKSIADLTGIEDFTALTFLQVQDNNLTEVDLSNNLYLDNLSIYNNALTALDLSTNVDLYRVNCDNNEITSLDVSSNIVLRDCSAVNNKLTVLDISNGNNTNVTYFRAQGNPYLTCIQVDNVNAIDANWVKDSSASYSESCDAPKTYVPDDNFEQALIDLGFDDVLDDYVTKVNINTITDLYIDNKSISDLTGIQDFVALISLNVDNNNLSTLDVSRNTSLLYLSFSQNNIEEIDVTENTDLEVLYCLENKLTTLDVSLNTNLTYIACNNNFLTTLNVTSNVLLQDLYCYNNMISVLDLSKNTTLYALLADNNELTALSVKNGNNINLSTFDVSSNANLTCIEVDDASYSTSNWTNIDATASFSENCDYTINIPDANFEQTLIDLGYDSGTPDGTVPTFNISSITDLSLFEKGISDLTGIDNFLALQTLNVGNNSLTNLDVSTLLNLTSLKCSNNSLGSLIINKDLEKLIAGGNNLTSLDFSENTKLKEIRVGYNPLTSLNIANGNNENITFIFTVETPNLSCVQVDNVTYSTDNWVSGSFTFDNANSFSEDCSATASVIDNEFNTAITAYPNPVKNRLYITINDGQELESIQVFNVLGRKILEQKNNNVDFTNISSGMYLVKIKNTKGKVATRKIIKN